MSGQPCGRCLNCRNGAPALCLLVRNGAPLGELRTPPRLAAEESPATERRVAALPERRATAPPGKTCNRCGAGVPSGRRYCDGCRTELRRATWTESQRRRRGATDAKLPTKRRGGRSGAALRARGRVALPLSPKGNNC